MVIKMKLGFIGLGNMAKAMIGGILSEGAARPEDIIGSAATRATVERAVTDYGIRAAENNRQTAEQCDLLILAVKPQYFEQVIGEIRDTVNKDQLVVSIAAGLTMEQIAGLFGKPVKLIRCMPNTPALVGEGCTGVCGNELVSGEELEECLKLMRSFGTADVVPEKLMDVVVGVSGSSPAYVFLFIEAMADEAVAEGMPRKQAYEFAAQAVLGSAKMVLETGTHPGELKDRVCSPGGTTIQAVKLLEEQGFRGTVMDAVKACIDRSREMGE